jgi:hypothetical protein
MNSRQKGGHLDFRICSIRDNALQALNECDSARLDSVEIPERRTDMVFKVGEVVADRELTFPPEFLQISRAWD